MRERANGTRVHEWANSVNGDVQTKDILMAYVVLCSLLQTIDHILHHDEYPLSVNGKQQIASLRIKVIFLREFLEKFPQEAKSLETRIRDAANEAEDIIEHFMYEQIRWNAAGRATDIQYDLVELDMVMEEINSFSPRREDMGRLVADRPAKQSAPSSSSTLDFENATVGLDEDLAKIRNLVCGESPQRQIIPITGMGGIGKTTLAKKVYHDQSVVEKFPVRAWVTVSQDYKTEDIFANLLDSLPRAVVGESSCSTKELLHKILVVRKYLIVLDDVWSESAWNDIRNALPVHNNGSRILITTRIEKVAAYAAPSSPHHKMRLMDSYRSWKLLKQEVFPMFKECPPALEKIGKDIAARCRGLPLAIVVVAPYLSTVDQTPNSWEEFAKDVRKVIQKDEQFRKTMSLSYTYLPRHLRPCLLYMGAFPEDGEIRVSKLVKLWIAEGFVKPRGSKSLEEVAEEYLEDLVSGSLALVTGNKSNGKIKSCSVHGFICDLCETMALDENFERRLSIAHPDLRRLGKAYGSTLRSVICFRPNESSLVGLRKLRLLRVLDVVDTDAYSIPAQVFELFHLRYLAFGCAMEIPAAICRLQNLRTLIILPRRKLRRYSTDEVYLPSEIWKMPLLEHLVSFFDLLPTPDGAASALEKLLTLSVVKKLICTKEMMDMIPNVKKLAITYFGDKYQEDYQLHNLHLLHQLEKLTLVLRKGPLLGLTANPVFPETLRKLTLSGWRLPWEVMETIGSLPKLQVLKLRDHACEGKTWYTNEGQFSSLEYLHIDESGLEEWDTEMRHFPRLKRLVLYRCSSLSWILNDIGNIVTLELIEVDHANESLVECIQEIQKEQQDCGNDFLQVRCVDYHQ